MFRLFVMSDSGQNPYAPPALADSPIPAHSSEPGERLLDPRPLGRIAVALLSLYCLWVTLVLALTFAGVSLIQLGIPRQALKWLPPTFIALLLGFMVIFLMWTYRCAKNAKRLAGSRMQTTPALTVWSYFIPFYCFFGPFISMKEIVSITNRHSERQLPKALIVGWWLPWVATWLINAFAGPSEIRWAVQVSLLLAGLLLNLIIVRLSAAQAEIVIAVPESITWRPPVPVGSSLPGKRNGDPSPTPLRIIGAGKPVFRPPTPPDKG